MQPLELTRNLWVFHSRLYATNSGVFLSAGRAGLIDPAVLPDEIQAIARFVKERGAGPRMLIITHSHWDHIFGPEHFPAVEVVAQANYISETSAQAARLIQREVDQWEKSAGIQREQPFAIPQPDRTFVEELTLDLGELTLCLVHAPGHAADELVVYEPERDILWAGDMLSDLEIPFVSHSLVAYESTLAKLVSWEIRALVPGHGQATTNPRQISDRLAEDRAYLGELRDRVEQSIRRGRTIEDTVATCGDMRFRHPEENAGPHRLNIESAYAELGGPADPAKVGWNRLANAASGAAE